MTEQETRDLMRVYILSRESYAEASRELGVSADTVRYHVRRNLPLLQDMRQDLEMLSSTSIDSLIKDTKSMLSKVVRGKAKGNPQALASSLRILQELKGTLGVVEAIQLPVDFPTKEILLSLAKGKTWEDATGSEMPEALRYALRQAMIQVGEKNQPAEHK